MRIFIFYLILIANAVAATCQSLSVFNIDTFAFPVIRAKFFAFDAAGNQIRNLTATDFSVTENGQLRSVLGVSCPAPKPPVALSSVLVMDQSGSMGSGNKLDLIHKATKSWIDALPGRSECAITSFDDYNYIVQDFTLNKTLLEQKAQSITANGGTDYNKAMIDPMSSGIDIAKTGKYKRVIVMLSDGLPNFEPRTSQIINEAKSNSIIIYFVSLGYPSPQCMKDITKQTGGQYFENVSSVEDAKKVYMKIMQAATGGEPCDISWTSVFSCSSNLINVDLKVNSLNLAATAIYQSPNNSIATLVFNPSTIVFKNVLPGNTKDSTVHITARNADFNVSDIKISNSSLFTIDKKNFILKKDSSIDLKISFAPTDSGYSYCQINIENDVCPNQIYWARGGWPGKRAIIQTIKLDHPNGGQVFLAGSDTVITWEGVTPQEKVRLEYSIDSGKRWIFITDTASGLSYKWHVPNTPSNLCLARVTGRAISTNYDDDNMVSIPSGTFQMGSTGSYFRDSSAFPVRIVTISKDFLMCKLEVTQKQYKEIMGSNPSNFIGDNLPVELVTWYEAVDFCNKLSIKEGLQPCYSGTVTSLICDWNAFGYRLPTEAEWEYACKAGTTSDFYSGSITNTSSFCNPIDTNLDKIGWYYCNTNAETKIGGQKLPNNFGLFDMSGNVFEWCWDILGSYNILDLVDPKGPTIGTRRIFRGGCCYWTANGCVSSKRNADEQTNKFQSSGFRIVRIY